MLLYEMNGSPAESGNRTLVAHWGRDKPTALVALLREFQQLTLRFLGHSFEPYEIDQIHATLVGLECMTPNRLAASSEDEELVVSRHAFEQSPAEATLHPVAPLEEVWRVHQEALFTRPMRIRFGGNSSPNRYRAAFQVGRTSVIVVGWPLSPDGSEFDDALWQYRAQIGARTGYVHKYARERDNDLYMVLGRLGSRPEGETVDALQGAGRELLSRREVMVRLDVASTRLVEYADHRLPPDSTRVLFGE